MDPNVGRKIIFVLRWNNDPRRPNLGSQMLPSITVWFKNQAAVSWRGNQVWGKQIIASIAQTFELGKPKLGPQMPPNVPDGFKQMGTKKVTKYFSGIGCLTRIITDVIEHNPNSTLHFIFLWCAEAGPILFAAQDRPIFFLSE